MVILKPHVTCPQVEINVNTAYSTSEGLRRLSQAVLAAALWLEEAQAKKAAK